MEVYIEIALFAASIIGIGVLYWLAKIADKIDGRK